MYTVRILTRQLRSRLWQSLQQSAEILRANIRTVGVIVVVGQPLYYVVWRMLSPEQYDSLALRLFSVASAIPMLFEPQLSKTEFGARWLTPYWFATLLFQLPFLFVFLALMNGFSTIWSLSIMGGITLLVVLVFDWLMIMLIAIVGSGLAWLAFELVDGHYVASGPPLVVLMPIFLFALIAGTVCNYKTELVAREKLSAMTDAIATMAHELRTPLLGIGSGAGGLERYLPALIDGYRLARDNDLPVEPIRSAHFREINAVLGRIQAETHYSSVVLDMLLVNSSRTDIDRSRFEPVSIRRCVDEALGRYPFASEQQAARVRAVDIQDFTFLGSQLLAVHVLFNLLKNALYFIDKKEDGEIRIWTEQRTGGPCQLHFRDNGPGVRPEALPRIFDRFYSDLPRGQSTGIGLAFAQLVMNSFHGHIACRSQIGCFTEFVLTFPPAVHPYG
ncbi:MAG: HAMP domain-containing sensor histidine kinase [Salinisphaera sp.]|nr:HAMP domain-containing sensor histidine kinase [Salinisphaera sp.]